MKFKTKAECPATPPHKVGEGCDCRERADCKKAGEIGHWSCGYCSKCGGLRFEGCLREGQCQFEVNQTLILRSLGLTRGR